MTVANQITIGRLLLIPVFVVFAAYYSASIQAGSEEIAYRIAALAVFALAALSDAVDGYIARNFNQQTALGTALDPVADKLLLLSGVVILSFTHWHAGLPIWFAVLVIARDLMIVIGVLVIKNVAGKVEMGPIRSSKICTFLQLSTVVWVLLDFWSKDGRPLALDLLIYLAAAFTIFSGSAYVKEGIRQLRESGHTTPESPSDEL